MDSLLGMLIFCGGGLAGATFLLPARGVKGWAYETWWLFYVVLGLVVCPPLICHFTVPDFWGIVAQAPLAVKLRCAGFGMMWGVGALAWGLMVRYLGIGLGLAIGCGLCAATGTILPPIMNGNAASLLFGADGALVPGKLVVMGGVVLSLVGIVFVGLAGRSKEREMPIEEQRKAVPEFNFGKGLVTAFVAGVFSSGMNLGLQGAGCIETAAEEAIRAAGGNVCWRGMPIIMVVLWGGFLVELAWCLQQHVRNRTFSDYLKFSPRNVLLCAAIGILWVMQFVCTKAGEPLMGELKYISFAVMMASTILFSTLIGVFLGEWKGTGAKTRGCLALGMLIMLVGFAAISLGSK